MNRLMIRRSAPLVVAASLLAAAACGGSDGPSDEPDEVGTTTTVAEDTESGAAGPADFDADLALGDIVNFTGMYSGYLAEGGVTPKGR